jgi:hypothetical protein
VAHCTNCGAALDAGASFCQSCGTRVGNPVPPPGYATPSYAQVPPPYAGGSIPNYLPQAILTTLFCCLPFGIVAIVNAAAVSGKQAAGDLAGAMEASRKAKMWAWVSFGVTLGVGLLWILILVISAAGSDSSYDY